MIIIHTITPFHLSKLCLSDIDARFSRISENLGNKSAKTLPELERVIETSTKKGFRCIQLPCVYNIRDWIAPYLQGINNHSFPHTFRYICMF